MDGEQQAEEILKQYGLDYVLKPIPVVDLCLKSGITRVTPVTFKDPTISGMIVSKPGNITIYCNKAEIPVRQRFTIAHELGHFMLNRDALENRGVIDHSESIREESMNCQIVGVPSPTERAANAFAMALLMPRRTIQDIRNSLTPEMLAAFFQMSVFAMRDRVKNV